MSYEDFDYAKLFDNNKSNTTVSNIDLGPTIALSIATSVPAIIKSKIKHDTLDLFSARDAANSNQEFYTDSYGKDRMLKTNEQIFYSYADHKVYDLKGNLIRDIKAEKETEYNSKAIEKAVKEKRGWYYGHAKDLPNSNKRIEISTGKRFQIRCVPSTSELEGSKNYWRYEKCYYVTGKEYIDERTITSISKEEFDFLGGYIEYTGPLAKRMWIEDWCKEHKISKSRTNDIAYVSLMTLHAKGEQYDFRPWANGI